MGTEFQVVGRNTAAPFTLKIHRGDGMALLAMDWKKGKPPKEFVGFAIEYKEPGGAAFFPLPNRLQFKPPLKGSPPDPRSTRLSPIQKFRWVHFPRNADLEGDFTYRVTPVFLDPEDKLTYGEPQEASLALQRETCPGRLNVAFTRGFVSSQAFVDRFESAGPVSALLPPKAEEGLEFSPSHPKAEEALAWMGFEARSAILELLDEALGDTKAQVRVVAYDLNDPEVVSRLERLGSRLKIIIDDSGTHKPASSAESQAATRLAASAGKAQVKRQHMKSLQHNKTIVVDGPMVKKALCGSTNLSWRGFFVQNNHALILTGPSAIQPFLDAFEAYWDGSAAAFGGTEAAQWHELGLKDLEVWATFSPHGADNAQLEVVAGDVAEETRSSLFYSLAFLYQTPGPVLDAIQKVSDQEGIFVYGISDREVGGLVLQKPDGNLAPVYPAALGKDLPAPFSKEPTGGGGIRMHHKFLVVDFDTPDARVWLGSYNFSGASDTSNGENLLLIRDRKVATSFMVEALRIFDHYHFRVAQAESKQAKKELSLKRPPRQAGEQPWWEEHYTDPRKVRDRKIFS
ncbi:MAG: phospholipase [Acidobacteria bacterium]|nr:phospholipase [Acidobacteriota bacterium]